MELDEARYIAKRVVPKLLIRLPQDVKMQLIKLEGSEDSLLFRMVEEAASEIQWVATGLENKRREQYM